MSVTAKYFRIPPKHIWTFGLGGCLHISSTYPPTVLHWTRVYHPVSPSKWHISDAHPCLHRTDSDITTPESSNSRIKTGDTDIGGIFIYRTLKMYQWHVEGNTWIPRAQNQQTAVQAHAYDNNRLWNWWTHPPPLTLVPDRNHFNRRFIETLCIYIANVAYKLD